MLRYYFWQSSGDARDWIRVFWVQGNGLPTDSLYYCFGHNPFFFLEKIYPLNNLILICLCVWWRNVHIERCPGLTYSCLCAQRSCLAVLRGLYVMSGMNWTQLQVRQVSHCPFTMSPTPNLILMGKIRDQQHLGRMLVGCFFSIGLFCFYLKLDPSVLIL